VKEQFAARAREVGALVYFTAGATAAVEKTLEILEAKNVTLAALSPDLGSTAPHVEQGLASRGIQILASNASLWDAERVGAGVTGAALGIAETGSLLIEGNDLPPRLATMLPLVHVVLMAEEALVPSLAEAGEHLRRSALGERGEPVRYASIVTGPSRTADVEKTLSTGVHGPGELHIVLFSQS
jgi:L-lactate dehydrogenase complex protein LldG